MSLAQTYHRTEMRLKSRFFDVKLDSQNIKPLSDARAVELGANFIGESFVFGIAAALIFAENVRSRSKAQERKDLIDENISRLEGEMADLKSWRSATNHKLDSLVSKLDLLISSTGASSSSPLSPSPEPMSPSQLQSQSQPSTQSPQSLLSATPVPLPSYYSRIRSWITGDTS